MSFMTMLASRIFSLPPAVTTRLEYQIDLPVPMPDGVVLLANRVAPRGGESLPIILIRNPYTSRGNKPDVMAQLIAERGYQVVVQNCRGTWGSGGTFRPFRDDREDGLATLRWLAQQPWFSGSVGMFGLSYWGYVQLASGPGAPDYLKALVPQMAASRLYGVFRAHETLALDCALTWHYQTYVANAASSPAEKRQAMKRRSSALRKGFMHLPVGEADQAALGFTVPFFQDLLRQEQPADELWAAMDHSKQIEQIDAPVHFIGGWYDFFLTDQLADYERLRKAGKQPYLTIGPWTHGSIASLKAEFLESFAWYDAHLKGNRSTLRSAPVRVFVMGIKKWLNLPAWPPACTPISWYLQAGGRLSPNAPSDLATGEQKASCYRYDPADPTPSLGGATVLNGGPKDNSKLEARPDVLTFTSQPMPQNTTIMGPVAAELYVRSSNEHTDFYARLCDVSPNGRKSINICDGIVRLPSVAEPAGPDGIQRIRIELPPTAHCFKTGHCIRLQVSSGAHPMYVRNLGTGEPIATGMAMRVADQEVFHSGSHPSAILLPVVENPTYN